MRRFRHASELVSAVGTSLGTSDWHQISQPAVDAFASLTGDKQWIHVDRERSERESPYGETIAHGTFILALVPFCVSALLQIDDAKMVVNVGLDKTRFRQPVTVGSCVRISASLTPPARPPPPPPRRARRPGGWVLATVRAIMVSDQTQGAVCTTEQRLLVHV